jgi:hypothetical protein
MPLRVKNALKWLFLSLSGMTGETVKVTRDFLNAELAKAETIEYLDKNNRVLQ